MHYMQFFRYNEINIKQGGSSCQKDHTPEREMIPAKPVKLTAVAKDSVKKTRRETAAGDRTSRDRDCSAAGKMTDLISMMS